MSTRVPGYITYINIYKKIYIHMHSAPYCVVARTTATYMTYIIIYMCVVVAGVYTIIFFLFIIVLKLLFIIT